MDWKIFIPPTLIDALIYWYHYLLGHCGTTKLEATIRDQFWALDLSKKIKEFQRPEECYIYKYPG